MDAGEREQIRQRHDNLLVQASSQEQPELLLRQLAEHIVDRLAERGRKGREQIRRLTDMCLSIERGD